MTEIVSAAERTALAEPEPSLTLTQLQSLLRAAADLERAQRPIVLHGPQTATAPHPGVDVRVAAPAAATPTVAVYRPRNIWPLVFTISGCAGIGSSVVAAATGNEFAILAVLTALATWGTSVFQLVFVREP